MRIPPPFYFVVAIVLGFLLGTYVSIPIEWLPAGVSSLMGSCFIGLAIVLAILSQRQLRRAGTGQLPGTATTCLVTAGPYAISRNPIYLAWAICQLGLGIWVRNVWIIVLLAPAILVVNVLAIIPEEHYLREKFGQSYQDYQRRVRRWL
jgi:protein-S-isoprenylcysteine O-methyltransferase Ste14